MTTIQIVNTIIILSLAPLIALCYLFAQGQIQRLPSHKRAALLQYSRQAALYVEYQCMYVDKKQINDKKAVAMAYAWDMFRLSGDPEPHADVLEVAVGAALYEISARQTDG